MMFLFVPLAKIAFVLLMVLLILYFIIDTILKTKIMTSDSNEERLRAAKKREHLVKYLKWLLFLFLWAGLYIVIVTLFVKG